MANNLNTMASEIHSILRIKDHSLPFPAQLAGIMDQIKEESRGRALRFVRFFLSDAGNQYDEVCSEAYSLGCVVSIIQQPPLDGSKIAAWCYWTIGELNPIYTHKMVCGLVPANLQSDSLSQTESVFSQYDVILSDVGETIADDCVRTWLFVRDVDTNYAGVVKGRKNCFDKIGLTADTHYIASTGIQGCTQEHHQLVSMDAYSIGGLRKGQKRYLYAKTHLNPTYEYGVTFERGTAIDYGDRRHIFISGTASIDNKGEILHKGDIAGQCGRMMENIEALLNEGECSISDISLSIVYLRDLADYLTVQRIFNERWPDLDPVIVLAPVCRPGWLVEMECIAIKYVSNPSFETF